MSDEVKNVEKPCAIDGVKLSDRALRVFKKDITMRIIFFEKYNEDDMKKEFENILKRIEVELSKRSEA